LRRSHVVGISPEEDALKLRFAPEGAEFMQLEEALRVAGKRRWRKLGEDSKAGGFFDGNLWGICYRYVGHKIRE
jgi:hypothetical protein